jgi:hypothetical protein
MVDGSAAPIYLMSIHLRSFLTTNLKENRLKRRFFAKIKSALVRSAVYVA